MPDISLLLPMLALLMAVGAFAGVMAGLLGVGGGIILVPAFFYVFTALGYGSDQLMQICLATSLATIIVTSLRSVASHNRKGAVDWDILQGLGAGDRPWRHPGRSRRRQPALDRPAGDLWRSCPCRRPLPRLRAEPLAAGGRDAEGAGSRGALPACGVPVGPDGYRGRVLRRASDDALRRGRSTGRWRRRRALVC